MILFIQLMVGMYDTTLNNGATDPPFWFVVVWWVGIPIVSAVIVMVVLKLISKSNEVKK